MIFTESVKWIWKYLKKYKFMYVLLLGINIVISVFTLVHPVIIGYLVQDIMDGKSIESLYKYAIMLMVAILIKEFLVYIRTIISENISQSVILKLRVTMFEKLQSLDMKFFKSTSTGDLMARLTMDADAVKVLISSAIPTLMLQSCMLVFGFITMFSINPIITLSLFLTAPVIAYYAYLNSKVLKQEYKIMRECNSKLNSEVQENISGNKVVKAYAMEEYETNKFEKKNKDYYDANMHYVYTWCKYHPTLVFWISMSNVMFVAVGGIFLVKGYVTLGEFTSLSGLVGSIVTPMATVGNIINTVQQFSASASKLKAIEDAVPEIENHKVLKRGAGLTGKVAFKNVSFKFEDEERVLKRINFTANPGDTVAIIGPTGSGKTTIVNLLSRFYDTSYGDIYIDDVNIKNIDIRTLRGSIAYAMQDIFLFSDTIKNNIAYGVPNATLDDIIRVAKAADAHDFISKMPDGYDTVVGEMGVGLSGGQRQRISLARALLKNPAILILDDTTSAVDMETEYEIQETLKSDYKNKTTFIIAHRISSVKNADLIIVLNKGHMVEWGTHEDLLKQNGYYKKVYDDQFGDFTKSDDYEFDIPYQIPEVDLV